MAKKISNTPYTQGLASSAKSALLWGGGFTFLRDVIQFATMLVLIRLLSPEDYGAAALAQSVVGLVSVISFGTFITHALQSRNPAEIDWQMHFTAAVFINVSLFCLSLMLAFVLSFTEQYHLAALPLAVSATLFLVEIGGSLRHRMLETMHNWIRFRVLLILGALLGSGTGLVVAFAGGGVWALVVQAPMLGFPAVIDLFFVAGWRPRLTWSWVDYSETFSFGLKRIGSFGASRGRQAVEHTILAGAYDFEALGVFSRAIGLGMLVAGRIGSLSVTSLHAVVTRADEQSKQFQKMAALILQGICWTTVPAAGLLMICGTDIVALIYGPKWDSVVAILPLAVAGVALTGIASATTHLILANNQLRTCLVINLISASIGVGLAFGFIPLGIDTYLTALAVHGLVILMLALSMLVIGRGISHKLIPIALFPPTIAVSAAALGVTIIRTSDVSNMHFSLRLLAEVCVFGATYIAVLRTCFPGSFKSLLDVVPGGLRIQSFLRLK